MRTLILVACVLFPGVVTADPFVPDRVSLIQTGSAFFVDTGTNSLCVFCEDADAGNDVMATLLGSIGGSGAWFNANPVILFSAFAVSTVGTTASSLAGLGHLFRIPMELRLWDSAEPELISITEGWVNGSVGFGFFGCCFGVMNTVHIDPVGQPFDPLPLNGFGLTGLLELSRPRDPAFTPIESVHAPEPTSLILLGSGLLLAFRHRRKLTASVS